MNRFDVVEQAFVSMLGKILAGGDDLTIRGMKVRELTSQMIHIEHPSQRCYFVPERNDNIFAKIAETLWMLAGRYDIEWLSYYLPRAADYSDDGGKTWRGAYGPRLRNFNGCNHKIDQIKYVLNILNLDPYSRQAVISIWDPSEDTIQFTRDRPCNNWLQFYARDNYGDGKLKLNLNITQRSCDILWGYSGIDTFSWSVLLQMMSYWTGYDVGHTNHFITSLHVYEPHWERVKKICKISIERFFNEKLGDYIMPNMSYGFHTPKFTTAFMDFDDRLSYIFSLEKCARELPDETEFEHYLQLDDEFLQVCYQMMFAYIMHKSNIPMSDIAYVLDQIVPCDLRAAAIEYFTRKDLEILKHMKSLTVEEKALLSYAYKRI